MSIRIQSENVTKEDINYEIGEDLPVAHAVEMTSDNKEYKHVATIETEVV